MAYLIFMQTHIHRLNTNSAFYRYTHAHVNIGYYNHIYLPCPTTQSLSFSVRFVSPSLPFITPSHSFYLSIPPNWTSFTLIKMPVARNYIDFLRLFIQMYSIIVTNRLTCLLFHTSPYSPAIRPQNKIIIIHYRHFICMRCLNKFMSFSWIKTTLILEKCATAAIYRLIYALLYKHGSVLLLMGVALIRQGSHDRIWLWNNSSSRFLHRKRANVRNAILCDPFIERVCKMKSFVTVEVSN